MLDTGRGGENWLAAHLQRQGWQLLAHRWRCQWGELDLVMLAGEVVVFIEVKTRKAGNWDADGAAAITPRQQTRLHQAAAVFLSQHPQWQHLPCRLDVALVRWTGRRYVLWRYLTGALS